MDGQRTGIPDEARQAAAKTFCAFDGEWETLSDRGRAAKIAQADAVLAAALPHLERQLRDKIADEIETHATSECSETVSRREDPELWVDLDGHTLARGGQVRLHYPVARPGYPCEGCEAAKAADESFRLAARVARGEG